MSDKSPVVIFLDKVHSLEVISGDLVVRFSDGGSNVSYEIETTDFMFYFDSRANWRNIIEHLQLPART